MNTPTRPASSAGWAPPFTNTPDEITDRRAVLLAETRRADYGKTHHTAAEWDRVIAAALRDLTDTRPTEPEEAS